MTQAPEHESLERAHSRRRRRGATGEEDQGSLLGSFNQTDARLFIVTFAATVTASLAAVMIVAGVADLDHLVTRHTTTGPRGSILGSKPPTVDWALWIGVVAAAFAFAGILFAAFRNRSRVLPWLVLALATVGGVILVLLKMGLAAGLT